MPTLIMVGDSDMLTPHMRWNCSRCCGGGVPGDMVAMPTSQLAVLPGTTHFTILSRTDLLLPILTPFLAG